MKHFYRVSYVSNAGVLLTFDNKKVLIDGFCNSVVPIFKNPPAEITTQITSGISPDKDIDIILFTHHHSDHFDPQSTVNFLNQNPNTVVIANHKALLAISRLQSAMANSHLVQADASGGAQEKLHEIDGVRIEAFSLLHDGDEYKDVQNFAYLIEGGGKTVLHVGDAKPVSNNYMDLNLLEKNIDLLIAPFPYVGLASSRRVIENYIKPHKIAVVHFPYRELDSGGWIDATRKSFKSVENHFIDTVFFEDIGDCMYI
ncbi:membrane protein [hydrocarbon metagenome]|uniref:Membrane protein n=1 Tax=hydrocarbon metagenome TaxID=938273 RepID=A0A0W8E232_9ZZZZ